VARNILVSNDVSIKAAASFDKILLAEFSDNTKITAWISGSDFMVEATGTAYSVAEIGEQLAWIAAALRSSPYDSGIVYCKPRLEKIYTKSPSHLAETAVKCHIGVNLDFIVQRDEKQFEQIQCQCWHNMFQSPVVVQGYPIRRRPEPETGLEIPLNVMAGLIGTQRANMFHGKLFIKGFSSMLVPTRFSQGIILWHFLQQEEGVRISYGFNQGVHAENVSISHLSEARHIVGWCSEVKNYGGKSSYDRVLCVSI
jgi:hypothetical protein